jgi:hypothetical protein
MVGVESCLIINFIDHIRRVLNILEVLQVKRLVASTTVGRIADEV